jgi:hypothetical protein
LDLLSNILKQRLEATQPAQTDHPSTDVLLAFVEHGLSPTEQGQVMSHLAVCSECRHVVALATPEASVQNAAAAVAPKPIFPFPAAVRWVSLAAALAVGVGVGVVSYEHQIANRSHANDGHEFTNPAVPEPPSAKAIAPVIPEVARTGTGSGDAATARTYNSEKKEFSSSKSGADVAVVRDSERKKGSIKRDNSNPTSGTVATRLGEARLSNEKNGTAPTLANSFSNSPQPGYDKASGIRNDYSGLQANASAASASPSASAASVSQTVEVQAYAAPAQTNDRSNSADRAGIMGGLAGGLAQTQPSSPAKAVRSAAIGGPVAAKTLALEDAELVGWTISASGRLQRSLTNGAVTTVEPAPGVTIRAVAAEGIEVWTAGVEPSLTSEQWQQRPVLFHSSDAGETWTRVSGPWQNAITSLRLASKNNLSVVAEDGTWVTSDAGKSWTKR